MKAKPLAIAQLGDPILRKKARKVGLAALLSRRIQTLIDRLIATCAESGGVGMAAPQVGHPLRIFIVHCHPTKRRPDLEVFGPEAMIDPVLTFPRKNKIVKDWEGCLSLPGLFGQVPRPDRIAVTYTDRRGARRSLALSGFIARICQHEYDHLDGIMFTDAGRVILETLVTESEWKKVMAKRSVKYLVEKR